MSSYFDELSRKVAVAARDNDGDGHFLDAVVAIERQLYEDVTAITGDREFPNDLREQMLGVLAVHGVY